MTRPQSLSSIPFLPILISAGWMALWYGVWLWSGGIYGVHTILGLSAVLIGFGPLLVWSIYQYRFGLVLTLVAVPLLVSPAIPHGFTQGFGDLFAAASIAGFLLRHPHPRHWRTLWQPEYIWLVFILLAAFISLLAAHIPHNAPYGIKYGFAEILGYCLDFAYLAIMLHELRSKDDFIAALKALAVALGVIFVYSLAGLALSSVCTGGYFGGRTIITANQSITSTFGSANYHAAYLVSTLPLALAFYLYRLRAHASPRPISLAVLLLVFFIQASFSRAAFLILGAIWLGWLAITRFEKGTRLLTVIMLLMLPMTYVIWWYPACTCSDSPRAFCPFPLGPETAPSVLSENQSIPRIGKRSAMDYVGSLNLKSDFSRTPKSEGGWKDQTRMQLAQNAFALWRQHPITGAGVGLMSNYSFASGQANRAHNMILTIAAEQGILGVMAWGGWILYLASLLWRNRPEDNEKSYGFYCLALAFGATLLESLFMDFYRMLWVWQLSAFILVWPRIASTRKDFHAAA